MSRSSNAAVRPVSDDDPGPHDRAETQRAFAIERSLTVAAPDSDPDFDDVDIARASLVSASPESRTSTADVLAFPAAKMREPAPDPTQWARSIMQATLEALHGVRPPGQLRRWYAPRVHAAVTARAAFGVRPMSTPPKIMIRSVRTIAVAEGRIEASGVFEVGGRCRAIALRMQTYDGRWRVTALEIG